MSANLYAICRMLNGTYETRKLKPYGGAEAVIVDAAKIKQLICSDEIVGGGNVCMVEVSAYQQYFTSGGELTGEYRRLLVPAINYMSRDRQKLYVTPLTVDDVRLPLLGISTTEPGNGYINPTIFSERKKEAEWRCVMSECPCNECNEYFGWIHVRRCDGVWIDRPWCGKHDDVCKPHEHGCIKKEVRHECR